MESFVIVETDGTISQVPMLKFSIGKQLEPLYIAIGAEFKGDEKFEIKEAPGISCSLIGRLDIQEDLVKPKLTIALKILGWPFSQYPNPEIIEVSFK